MKKRFFILWSIWSLLCAALIYGVTASDSKNSIMTVVAMVLSISPLLGIMLALGSAKAFEFFKDWLHKNKYSVFYTAGGITFLFALPGILTNSFNPYYTTVVAFIVFAVFGALKQLKSEIYLPGWAELAFWILLWIPFDLRWYSDMHSLLDYNWWSIAVSVIAIIGWHGYRNADIGYRLVPRLKDLYIVLIALAGIMIVVVPPGLISGFLTFAVPEKLNYSRLAAHFIGLFLTVALPEEIFFRGLLLRGLEKATSRKWMPLLVSSLAFGLMHWNNVSELSTQITYVILASIAGLGYAWAYKKSGNNLLSAVLTHTLVDWIWKLLLAG